MPDFFRTPGSRFYFAPDKPVGSNGSTLDHPMPHHDVGYLIRDVHRAFQRSLQARIASHGVSIGQWFFLRALWEEDGLTQRELSQRVGMMEPTTVTALNSMERRGLVERVRNPHDRRKVNIFLTPKGRGLRDVLLPYATDINDQATRHIDGADLNLTVAALCRIVSNLNDEELRFVRSDSVDRGVTDFHEVEEPK
jgi:DNA-binding MarR family transcriptional regulator